MFNACVINERGNINCDIEIQLRNHDSFKDRLVYYGATLLAGSLESKETYSKMKRVIVICLADFIMFKDMEKYQGNFILKDEDSEQKLSDIMKIVTLEMPKVDETKSVSEMTDKEKWLIYVKYNGYDEYREKISEIVKESEAIEMAEKVFDEVKSDDQVRTALLSRQRFQYDIKAQINDSYDKGVLETNRVIVRNCHKLGIPIKIIAEATGLTENEVIDQMKTLPMKQFPISSKYDADWILDNEMGPCSIWLCEWLMEKMDLKPGDRVLDMGCGKGMTSIFLAREYGVNVVANDLWIPAGDNWKRFDAAGVADKVIPIHAEAHDLPYADEYFDAVISVDSYHYYGTDVLYLDYISRFLKPGGQIGIVVPGLKTEFDPLVPERMETYWYDDMYTFHTSWWWKQLWEYSKNIEVLHSRHMTDGFDVWRHWEKDIIGADSSGDMLNLLEADGGEFLTFVRTVGRKKDFLKMVKNLLTS